VFEDLIALVALYRPGPMQYIPVYARRKAGQEPVTYPDPRLKEITGSTWGIAIFQEQSMDIAKKVAGFSPAEADDLRKAIGK
jgi:DNA polymerase-3 subunit alpha